MYAINEERKSEHFEEQNGDEPIIARTQLFCENNIGRWQNAGIMQVSTESRDKMIKDQKDAVLRRRKQQLQSGFIKSFNTQTTIKKLESDPHVVPTVKTFYSTSKQVTVKVKEDVRREPPRLRMNVQPANNFKKRQTL